MKAKSRTALYYQKNPEARKKRLEQQSEYQKKPSQVKKRVELNKEARKRKIYGKRRDMGVDLSHTKDGKMVLENSSKNRARNRGKK